MVSCITLAHTLHSKSSLRSLQKQYTHRGQLSQQPTGLVCVCVHYACVCVCLLLFCDDKMVKTHDLSDNQHEIPLNACRSG